MKQPKYKKKDFAAGTQKSTRVDNKEKEISGPSVHKHPKLLLAGKVLVILAIVIGVVNYTDNKKYFEPVLTFHQKREAISYIEFTKKDTVDVLLLGNSIMGAGLNCHILSCALGVNSFSYFSSGADMKDVYFTLKDALQRNIPKVVVIETFAIGDILSTNMPMLKKTMGFRERTDTLQKILSMPYLFSIEEFAGAWSYTIRNHDFIFKDTAQISTNINFKDTATYKTTYLGDSNVNLPCITDSTDAIYDSLGPSIDGSKVSLHDFDKEYILKTKELCDKNGIKLVFLTIPTYWKNIKNYNIWKKELESVIKPTNCPWLDLQANYDTIHYTKSFFEDCYKINLHMHYNGAVWITNQFAEFLSENVGEYLPNRTKQENWNKIFYASEGYFMNNAPKDGDTMYFNLCNDKAFENIKIQNSYWFKTDKNINLIVKFDKKNFPKELVGKPIELIVKGVYQGRDINAIIKVEPTLGTYPFKNHMYSIGLVREFTPKDIVGMKIQKIAVRG